MRLFALSALLLVVACAPVKSLEQLEAEALATGDWSAVEKRERVLAMRAERNAVNCQSGFIEYCQMIGGSERCSCVTRQRVDEFFAGR